MLLPNEQSDILKATLGRDFNHMCNVYMKVVERLAKENSRLQYTIHELEDELAYLERGN